MRISFFYTVLLLLIFRVCGFAQEVPPYKNPDLSIDERVQDLLQRMSPEEKFWQLFMIPEDFDSNDPNRYRYGAFGFQFGAASQDGNVAGQILNYDASESAASLARRINKMQKYFVEETRLGIPIIAFSEALHGLVLEGCTVFPQAIGLAATWDTELMKEISSVIVEESKIRGIRQILSPVINIASDVRWGRVEETYGEDPFLTSKMALAFVSPFEENGIITTPKHLIANVGDGGRDSYPIHMSERFLEEIHFPPFKEVFSKGGTRSVMTSYNSLDGEACSSSHWLLNEKVKKEWGFEGFIISDASAVGGANVLHYTSPDYPSSSEQAITGGLDVIFQTAYKHYELFIPPFLDGRIDKKVIDEAVGRVLKAKFELGLFEHPYVSETLIKKDISEHKELARQAARESIVLIKNDQGILPLNKNIRSIAVIGTDANEARFGGYSGPGNGKISILEGIKQKLGKNSKVLYAEGCGRNTIEWVTVPENCLSNTFNHKKAKGIKGEYFNNLTFSGEPTLTRIDKKVDFQWTLFSPNPKLENDFYSVRWSGKITSPESGTFKIGLDGNDGYRLFINGKLLIDRWDKLTYSTSLADFHFEKNKTYDLNVEFYEPVGNAKIRLVWNVGVDDNWQEKIQKSVATVQKAEAAIVVVGINEGEFQDRASLALPGHQETLIGEIAKTGKPVIVVIVGGSAVTMTNWMNRVPAILGVWYPGEEGGHAVADVLFGDYNPAGRLPVTFPISEAQLPLVYNHKPTGRGDDYNNLSGLPLFPFGYGLSYTQFTYSNLHFEKDTISQNESTRVWFNIKNTGDRDGDEVVQLYIRDLLATVAQPVMELKGFKRVRLKAGEEKEICFFIEPDLLKMFNRKMEEVVEPGDFRIMIGTSSRDLRLKKTLTISK